MLGYFANKALSCGLMWSVTWCLPLCLGSMAAGPSSQHEKYIHWKGHNNGYCLVLNIG